MRKKINTRFLFEIIAVIILFILSSPFILACLLVLLVCAFFSACSYIRVWFQEYKENKKYEKYEQYEQYEKV